MMGEASSLWLQLALLPLCRSKENRQLLNGCLASFQVLLAEPATVDVSFKSAPTLLKSIERREGLLHRRRRRFGCHLRHRLLQLGQGDCRALAHHLDLRPWGPLGELVKGGEVTKRGERVVER